MSTKIGIGLDIGHGESAARFVQLKTKDGAVVEKPIISALQVKNNTPKIFSTISYYDNGTMDIGTINDKAIAYFKRSPSDWNEECPNTGGKAYREVMGDFIGKIVECLLNSDVNPELGGFSKDELSLYVGCPSDKTWISDANKLAYEKLIYENTGIKDITVVAESTAAIFSAVGNNHNSKLNPSKGAAVYDFGSLTSDLTYIKLGETLIEASWQLGASTIEANIVEKIMMGELGDDYSLVYDGDLALRQLECRRDVKEAWFGDSTTPGYIVTKPQGINLTIS